MVRVAKSFSVPGTGTRAFAIALIAVLHTAAQNLRADAPEGIEYFEKHIRPLLVDHCYSCHSSKSEGGPKGGLSLEFKGGWSRGGDSGPVIVPGAPERSLLLKAIKHSDVSLQMPKKAPKLEAEAIAHIEDWIRMGAPDPRTGEPASAPRPSASHWAFQPVTSPAVPVLKNRRPARNEVDAFLLSRLEARGLQFSPREDSRTLARRLSFVLTGLPLSTEETDRFTRDRSEGAYERLVDQLLDSPRYGERWARHWLDIARYADTKGYVFEEERRYPYSYTYRDYVIRAFNEDLPYNRFLREQLAADHLVEGPDKRPLAAMGYLTLGRRFLNNAHDIIDDRIDVVTRGMMGLTVVCARCHDHKYDPIPTADYYSLYGVFASSHEPAEKPLLGDSALPPEHPQYLAEREKRVAERVSYRAEQDAEALLKMRSQTGDYLWFIHENREVKDGETVDKLAREAKLSPPATRKFRNRASAWAKEPPPAIAPWVRWTSVALTGSNLAGVIRADIQSDGSTGKMLRSAGFSVSNAPSSLQDAVGVYNRWFARAAEAMHKKRAPEADPDLAEARSLLEGADSPFALNEEELHRAFPTPVQQKLRALQRKIDELDATHPGAPPRAMAMLDNSSPHEPRIFKRGNPGMPGDVVPRRFLEILSKGERKPFSKGSGRLELADMIASPANPLTARVWVNRVWHHHFGTPLVKTPSDFGVRSDPPSHPELLDYLATRFMADGWSVKKLHRLILTSSAFQQSAESNEVGEKLDPGNELYWKQNRRRLDFESMRDSILSVAGNLDLKAGGHPVDITTRPFSGRRTLYGFVERQNLPGLFRTFDFASPDTTSPQRFLTTVPQQALFLMNSPFLMDQARALARRPEIVAASTDSEKVKRLHRLLYQRSPEPEELTLSREFLKTALDAADTQPEMPVWSYGFGSLDERMGQVKFNPLPHFTKYAWQGGKDLPDAKTGWALVSGS
ncbi:MAG: DUF1553 domain-containing protein, partial [Verrucomicrobia bacterium]|nr:DUF1553 domain-containing protein [Verrucomicrobiota bacterium]